MKKKIVNVWKSCGWESLLFGLLFLPNLAALFFSSELNGSLAMKGEHVLFALIWWLLPFLFLKTRKAFLLCGIGLLFAPLEIGHFYYLGIPTSPITLRTILVSDRNEALEFMGNVWLLLLPWLVLCLIYFYGVFRISDRFLFSGKWRKRLFGGGVLINLILYGIQWKQVVPEQETNRFELAREKLQERYCQVYPFSFAFAVQNVAKMHWRIQNRADFRFEVTGDTIPERRIVVWVMGESSRYDHYSVNGYERPTSPELSALPGLLSYKRMYTEANFTVVALPLFLTRATPQSPELSFQERTILDLFAEAGFRTSWIGNQSTENVFVSGIAGDADYAYFPSLNTNTNLNYDEKLLPKVEEQLEKGGDLFILLHVYGSHFMYNLRYPPSFEHFKPALEGATSYADLTRENKEKIVNSYDNTILYTDYILSSLIRMVEKQQAASVVLFTSDHGEALFDDAKTERTHGNTSPSRYELHVPLFVWTSEIYNELYPEKRRNMENRLDAPLNSSNLFYSVADLFSLRFPAEKTEKSVASDAFVPDSVSYLLTIDNRVVRVR